MTGAPKGLSPFVTDACKIHVSAGRRSKTLLQVQMEMDFVRSVEVSCTTTLVNNCRGSLSLPLNIGSFSLRGWGFYKATFVSAREAKTIRMSEILKR